jgi:hypothetical protein
MNLKFPELRGGTFQGLNDAGVENFQGAIDVYVSRECGQNTGDAPGAGIKTVRLVFERMTMRASDIPAFSQMRETLAACLERWKDKEKEKEFFEQAVNLASKDELMFPFPAARSSAPCVPKSSLRLWAVIQFYNDYGLTCAFRLVADWCSFPIRHAGRIRSGCRRFASIGTE